MKKIDMKYRKISEGANNIAQQRVLGLLRSAQSWPPLVANFGYSQKGMLT